MNYDNYLFIKLFKTAIKAKENGYNNVTKTYIRLPENKNVDVVCMNEINSII